MFNLSKTSIDVLNNSTVGENDFKGRYGNIVNNLVSILQIFANFFNYIFFMFIYLNFYIFLINRKKMFGLYLNDINHSKAEEISDENLKPKRIRMIWRTKKIK